MDFSFDEDQNAIRDLAKQIFTDRTTDDDVEKAIQAVADVAEYGRVRSGAATVAAAT